MVVGLAGLVAAVLAMWVEDVALKGAGERSRDAVSTPAGALAVLTRETAAWAAWAGVGELVGALPAGVPGVVVDGAGRCCSVEQAIMRKPAEARDAAALARRWPVAGGLAVPGHVHPEDQPGPSERSTSPTSCQRE